MKRILLYIDTMGYGGAQRVMSNLANYFCNEGYDVVMCNDVVLQKDIAQYKLPSQVKRVYLEENNKGNLFVKNIHRIVRLRRIVLAEKPDCVLSFLGNPNLRMLVALWGLRVKKVVSVRNDPEKEYGKGIRRWLSKQIFRLADGYVFQTKDAMAYFPEFIQRKACVILNPIEKRFYIDGELASRKHIVTVGRLEEQKNHIMLLEAFSKIAQKIPCENLLIYGDGPLRSVLEKQVERLGLKERVFFQGKVAQIENELRKAKIFVLSSDYEGLPNALMEAMASGVPCIATDCPCGGPKMLFRDGADAPLVPCKDTDALARQIQNLLLDDKRRMSVGHSLRKRAEVFYAERIYQQWNDYIERIVNNDGT